ncbi:MAG: class I SAM-dependent rRNA methyltransferase [Candidatus Rokubacteria bacterium]|nr:class I SAM-dependent rRNA methyltransferase [Candidatus Rokubacteria bacterium]
MLRLRRGRESRARVHPWIFEGDVAQVSDVEPGGAVTVVDAAGRFVGRGFYNPRPALCCRIATRVDEPLDAGFFRRRVEAALARRARGGEVPGLARLVWSEADGLPGLVVDRYGAVLVVQCLTLGMARARAEVAGALRSFLGPLPVASMDEATPARLEGFEPARGWLDEPGPETVIVEEGGVRLGVRPGTGQKTGLYLDQRENRARVGGLARGRQVLDAFSYTAGFACHALRAGAERALCIESSSEAVAGARENLALNGVAERAQITQANAFDELRRLARSRARFGLIVLDPPPFTRGRGAREAAARGYKEINLRAMRLLEPQGILATFSCSHHVSGEAFEEICRDAAVDSGMSLRVLEHLTQASDHPVLLTVPETHYLKGLLLEAV